jgi:hypothetical protein
MVTVVCVQPLAVTVNVTLAVVGLVNLPLSVTGTVVVPSELALPVNENDPAVVTGIFVSIQKLSAPVELIRQVWSSPKVER